MYYKVKLSEIPFVQDEHEQSKTSCYVKVFEASSEKQLDEKISAYIDEITYATTEVLEKKQVSADELVEEAKQELFQEIFKKYMQVKLKPAKLDAQKYAELKNKYLSNPKYFYQMLQYEIKTMLVEEYLGRYNPHFIQTMKDMSAKQYFDRVTMLSEDEADTIGD